MNRRRFLATSAASAGYAVTRTSTSTFAGQPRPAASDGIAVAVMGVRGRGGGLLRTFADRPDVDVLYVLHIY
jgi:hypothetical protein